MGGRLDWTDDELRALIPIGSATFISDFDADRLGSSLVFIDDDQHVYEFCAASAQDLSSHIRHLPPGYRLQPFAPGLAEEAIVALGADALGLFRDLFDFQRRGFGICVLEDSEVIAIATSLMRSRDQVEMSVYTRPEHRRQGLARAAAAEMLSVCRLRHWRPVWQATNHESRSLAESLGFVDPRSVTAYMRIM